ncbi:MAG: Na+/H+ antiporter NhaA [Pseudomonadales bacterium]|nr:Na+/H+ antiporter NhaA [Pseudomonadales bacterium]
MVLQKVKAFFQFEASGGILLVLATLLAMLVVNSPLQMYYDALLDIPFEVRLGDFQIEKPILLWINDGLMAIFFFLIGLEIKREALIGELSNPAQVVLPVVAAVGGMIVPALVYALFNWGDPAAMKGWAIPSATDIAFALGVLALLGDRVPASLKIFLMTLAIADDLGAVVIIAIFYTAELSLISLVVAAVSIALLSLLNRKGVLRLTPYMLLTVVLWGAVLKSGVHATLAGVLAAMFIPFRKEEGESETQLERLEHDLQPTVAFGILPLFAFANTGVSFAGLTLASFLQPVPLGITAGLFLGKQIGIVGFSWVTVKLGLARLPQGAGWGHIYGVSLLCGIGFTMSLFIGSLAFVQGSLDFQVNDRLGILAGSLLSGLAGYAVLRWLVPARPDRKAKADQSGGT